MPSIARASLLPVRPTDPWTQRWLRTAPIRVVRKIAFNGLGLMPAAEMLHAQFQRSLNRRGRLFEESECSRLAALVPSVRRRFGVVIATYERPASCAAAVASVLCQEDADCLVVVVNDGGAVPALPVDDRVVIVSLSQHTGNLGLIRNVGIRLIAECVEMVAFLDDDNTWLQTHLAVHATVHGADRPTLSYSAVEVVDEHGYLVGFLDHRWSRAKLRHRNFVDANSVVVDATAASLFSRLHRANLSMRKEDWEYVYRQSRHLSVVSIDNVTVRYLRNPASYLTDHPIENRTMVINGD
ncbi:MAG: glycosyltransferase [Acidimicrobiales bacterium]